MADKRVKRKHRKSLIISALDRFTAFIYSFFTNGRIGDMLCSRDTLCKRSYLANAFSRRNQYSGKALSRCSEAVLENSAATKTMVFLRGFFASLKLNVYGVFFTFFGLTSAIVCLIPAMDTGIGAIDKSAMLTSVIITICAIPPMFSSHSASEAIYNSKFMNRIALNVLCIPKEKFKSKKQFGGTGFIFVSSILAMLLGITTYYLNPLFVPLALLCVFVLFLVFSSPEAGVIITLALVPFMQYLKRPQMILLVLIIATAMSYFCKVFEKRRHFSLSPEICMVLLFCAFTVTGALFSHGCTETLFDTLSTVVIILGGFFLTYNLLRSEKLLAAAFKTVTASFMVLCIMAVWESSLYGISNRIIDDVSPNISKLTESNVLYIADNGVVFGLFVILIFPMLFSYATRRRSVKDTTLVLSLCVLAISAAWMRSHYEIIVALVIETVIFWVMYSHKTLTTALIVMIPASTVVLLYPYAVHYFKFPVISQILSEHIPARVVGYEMHPSVVRDVFTMITDGHLFGIGTGEHAFASEFAHYASASSLGAENPMSLWLEILCCSGIFGFISFFIFVVFLVKRSCGFLIDQRSKELRARTLALFCGLVGAMLFGSVYSIWMDERILYMFWAFAGLLMGYIRLGQEREDARQTEFRNVEDEKDVELIFCK